MKKLMIILLITVVLIINIFCLVACDDNDEIWYSKDYWYGNYSEEITRSYSVGNVSNSQLTSVSPNGEREVQFEILIMLNEDGTAYLSRKIINCDNNVYDFVLEGFWNFSEMNDYTLKHNINGLPDWPDELLYELRVYKEDSNDDWYTLESSLYTLNS